MLHASFKFLSVVIRIKYRASITCKHFFFGLINISINFHIIFVESDKVLTILYSLSIILIFKGDEIIFAVNKFGQLWSLITPRFLLIIKFFDSFNLTYCIFKEIIIIVKELSLFCLFIVPMKQICITNLLRESLWQSLLDICYLNLLVV